jgi:hypothetical protein
VITGSGVENVAVATPGTIDTSTLVELEGTEKAADATFRLTVTF